MAKRKPTSEGVEPVLLALAEQLGTFLGRVQKKADHLLENETVQQQVSQIRDGATQLLERVKSSLKSAKKSATVAPPAPRKLRSGGTVDAPGKRHRKPPPQEKINRHMGEPVGKQMGQKSMKNRRLSGRG